MIPKTLTSISCSMNMIWPSVMRMERSSSYPLSCMRHFHVSPLVVAPKAGKLSRVCLNLSFTLRQHDDIFPSYNDGVDTERAYADDYPYDPLPTLVTILVEEISGPRVLRWLHCRHGFRVPAVRHDPRESLYGSNNT
jgi:hypothetical protein